MKKLLSIVLVLFIVLLGAAGCASPRASEPSSPQVPTVFGNLPYVVDDYTEIEELFIMELTEYIDDIVERHDFVICRDYEYGVSAI